MIEAHQLERLRRQLPRIRWNRRDPAPGTAEPLHLGEEVLPAPQLRLHFLPLGDLVLQLLIGALQRFAAPNLDRCGDQHGGEDDYHGNADREAESLEMERDQQRCHRERGQDDHDPVPHDLPRRSALHAIPPRLAAHDHTGTIAAKTSGSCRLTAVNDDAIVFVVDDDASVRRSTERLVRPLGFGIQTFASAREFLDSARVERPACLVLDVQMPGVSGLELQRELAQRGVEIPIVFLTGHGDIPMTVRAMKAGAVEFLTKPVKSRDLLAAIRGAIERGRASHQARREIARCASATNDSRRASGRSCRSSSRACSTSRSQASSRSRSARSSSIARTS